MIYLAGPGHGGPALVANVYLEGTYREIYPDGHAETRRACGAFSASSRRRAAFRATSASPTPGSIHEGGELGYVLTHAFGAAFDNPDLHRRRGRRRRRGGDRPAGGLVEGHRFLNPARDGAVLPILHLNGYKIADPTVLGRARRRRRSRAARRARLRGALRRGRRCRCSMHQAFAATLDACYAQIRAIQQRGPRAAASRAGRAGRRSCCARRRAGPARKRSTGCRSRARSAPTRCRFADVRTNPEHLRSSRRGCGATSPTSCSIESGTLLPELAALAPDGRPAHGRESARQRRQAAGRASTCPTFATTRSPVAQPGTRASRSRRGSWARCCATSYARTPGRRTSASSARTRRTPTGWSDVFEVENRCFVGQTISHRRPRLAGRARDGGAERAPLRGLAGRLPADRPARPLRDLRGVRDGRRPR